MLQSQMKKLRDLDIMGQNRATYIQNSICMGLCGALSMNPLFRCFIMCLEYWIHIHICKALHLMFYLLIQTHVYTMFHPSFSSSKASVPKIRD